MAQWLLSSGAKVDAAMPDGGETALSLTSERGHAKVVKTLLSAGAAVNAATTNGTTSLYMAAQNGHLEVVDMLLAAEANANAADDGGHTALYYASFQGLDPLSNKGCESR